MSWPLSFITQENFYHHTQATIAQYGEKLEPYDLKRFNKNTIDPIKLIFDKNVYGFSWEEIIKNELFRQRDKANNNDIGYFHQQIFKYINHCTVPSNGWDVIVAPPNGIDMENNTRVSRLFVEMKNKHNTMNSASAGKTYIKMQSQLLDDDDCACFLVEAIAKESQNIAWVVSVDGEQKKHKFIRRVSLDQFYALVTGQQDAFYQLCTVLPTIIQEIVSNTSQPLVPTDTVFDELKARNATSFSLALYMLGFSSYWGFNQ